jgi:hypothetical protein
LAADNIFFIRITFIVFAVIVDWWPVIFIFDIFEALSLLPNSQAATLSVCWYYAIIAATLLLLFFFFIFFFFFFFFFIIQVTISYCWY